MSGRRACALIGLAVLAVPLPMTAAHAVWTDSAAVSGTRISTGVVPAPAGFVCQPLGLLSISFSWQAVPGATGYTVYFDNGARLLPTTQTSLTVTSVLSTSTAWVVAHRSFGQTTWTSAFSNTRSYTLGLLCG